MAHPLFNECDRISLERLAEDVARRCDMDNTYAAQVVGNYIGHWFGRPDAPSAWWYEGGWPPFVRISLAAAWQTLWTSMLGGLPPWAEAALAVATTVATTVAATHRRDLAGMSELLTCATQIARKTVLYLAQIAARVILPTGAVHSSDGRRHGILGR